MARRVADVPLAGLVLYFLITGIGRLPQVGGVGVAVIAVLVTVSVAPVVPPSWGSVESGSTISHHPKTLREAGLVDAERRASWAYYRPQVPRPPSNATGGHRFICCSFDQADMTQRALTQ